MKVERRKGEDAEGRGREEVGKERRREGREAGEGKTATVQDLDDYRQLIGSDVKSIEQRHFPCDFLYNFGAINKISADTERRAVPLPQLCLLQKLSKVSLICTVLYYELLISNALRYGTC